MQQHPQHTFLFFSESNINRDNVLSSAGIILIGIAVVFLDSRRIQPFPNVYTLVPTIGATLIILYGQKHTFVGYILSTNPLRWIGLVSYSVYLWHQPLLAFFRLRYDDIPNNSQLVVILIGVSFLSTCSYFFVEQPFRTNKQFSRKYIFILSIIFMLITFFLAVFFIRTAANRSQVRSTGKDTYLSDLKLYGGMSYTARAYNALGTNKTFSNSTTMNNKRILLIGDSYSQDFYNIIREGRYFPDYEIRVYFISVDCQIYIGTENRLNLLIHPRHKQKCTGNHDIKQALPMIWQANIIILAASWRPWSAQRLPMTLKALNLTEQQQLFVIGAKHFGTVRRMLYAKKSKEYRIKQYGRPKQMYIDVNQLLEKMIKKSSFVNVLKMICTGPNFTCPHFTPEGKLISYDNFHLTKHGVLYVGNILFKNKPLNKFRTRD